MARGVIVLDSVQEVRDLPESVRRQLDVIVPPAAKIYTYVAGSREVDDGSTWLKPTDTACECCKGKGRWKGTGLGSGGTSTGGETYDPLTDPLLLNLTE